MSVMWFGKGLDSMGYTDLCVKGTMNFMGIEIPVVSGGFGEDKMCILAKTVAEVHGVTVAEVNQNIKRNEKRFKDGIDIIDLKTDNFQLCVLKDLGLTQAQIGNAKHIYLLSERGYAKLIKIMDDDTSWDVHDKLVDDYFNMREKLQNTLPQISKKQQCVLTMFDDNATEYDKVIAMQDFGDISRGEACQSVITLDKVEELVIESLKNEDDIILHMSRLQIREIFHKTLYRLGYITYQQFQTKDKKRLERVWTKVPTNSFYEVFADRGLAVVREITTNGDDRGKVEITYTRFIVKWLQTEQFKQTYLKIAHDLVLIQ